jgi:ketosteroid isomerase-like protein
MMNDAASVAREFWRLMAGNDFYAVGAVLAPGFVLEWPQSNERVRGAENFAALNTEYPANGAWRFTVNRVFGTATEAVSDVSITDGVKNARAISFFTVVEGKIAHMTEFWPEPYDPPPNRRHLTEPLS